MQQTDFLIIGSGIAGLTAALQLSDKGHVVIATKSNLLESSSRYAQAGIAAVRNLRWDSFAEHYRDTLFAGCGINDKTAVKFFVQQAPQAVAWLAKLGVKFQKNPTREAAHSHSRVWHTRDSTGASIEKVLAREVRRKKNIHILTNTTLLDLAMNGRVCVGGILKHSEKIFCLSAGQTILATGGFGQLYARTTNPTVSVGDGIAAAARAGARLRHLEFVQFHPTALVGHQTRLTLLSESLRGEGAVLRNARGERFLPAYHPAAELAPRDIVARAIFSEMRHGRVYLDFTRADAKFLRARFPFIWREVKKAGFNLAQDLIPIFPVAHYACGGIATDLHGASSLENLFAVGEVADTGIHGANRLASNSLAEAVVFGLAVGQAGKILPKAKSVAVPRHQYFFDTPEDQHTLSQIQKIMWEQVGIVRSRSGLTTAKKALQKLRPKSFASQNALTVASLVTAAALRRKKSLGAHFRVD